MTTDRPRPFLPTARPDERSCPPRAADRRRRPVGVPGRRPRPAPAVRRTTTGSCAPTSGAGGAGGAARARSCAASRSPRPARRLPDAADERHRVPRAGDGPVPARPAGAADGVRRHRRGDRGDQRRRRRPLPAQAVGPAGGEALPGGRRDARRLRSEPDIADRARPRWSATAGRAPSFEVRDFLARNAVPYRWFGVDEPEGSGCSPRPSAGPDDVPGRDHHPTADAGRARRRPSWPTAVGLSTDAGDGLLRPGRRRRRPGRARRGGLRRLRGTADRAGRAAGDRRPGRADRRGSRTTSASPTACPARSSPTGPAGRRLRFGAEILTARDVVGLEAQGPARTAASSPTAARSPRHAVVLATGVSYRELAPPGCAELTGRGVYYGSAATEAPACAERGRLHRRRRQLGRPGRGVLLPASPSR